MGGLWSRPTAPKRRLSKDLPPRFPELMDKHKTHAASFISEFENNEHRMTEIVGEFQKITAEVGKMQQRTAEAGTTTRLVAGGIGVGLLILAAPLTGRLSLLAVGAAAGATAVGLGASVAEGALNIRKTMKENQSAEEVEKLGKGFLETVELLKKDLEEIKRTGERLEEESTEVQAESTLSDMEEFHGIFRQVCQLGRRERTTEEDEKLRVSIIQSAEQSQKIVDEFKKMKKELHKYLPR